MTQTSTSVMGAACALFAFSTARIARIALLVARCTPYGFCNCNNGWGGIDCNTQLKPCGRLGWGVPNVQSQRSGWVSDGYEPYAENLNCSWVIRPGKSRGASLSLVCVTWFVSSSVSAVCVEMTNRFGPLAEFLWLSVMAKVVDVLSPSRY